MPRSVVENRIIIDYLKTLSEFIKLLEQNSSSLEELLFEISHSLTYERLQASNIVFQYGDKAKKFYIILKGKVAILLPEKITMSISQEEYYKYLLTLKKLGELEILEKCLKLNKNIYPIKEEEMEWFLGKVMTLKGRKFNTPLQDFLFKLSVREYTNKFKNDDFDLWQANLLNINSKANSEGQLNADEYIKSLSPNTLNLESFLNEVKEVNIFLFNKVSTLDKGNKFGDVALISASQKRNETLITEQDCYFGILDKNSFLKCLSDVSDKMNRCVLSFLVSQKIFSKMNLNNFQNNYFNLFLPKQLKKGDRISKENSDAESVYFIREGEFLISGRKTFIQLCDQVNQFGGDVNKFYKPLDNMRGNFN